MQDLILTISRETMLKEINLYLTGVLESITCSCAHDIDYEAYYEFPNWTTKNGEIKTLLLSGAEIAEGYRNYNKAIPIGIIVRAEAKGNTTIVPRFYKYIKDIT